METMEHNETNPEVCDCPACHLNAIYEADYTKWEKLPAYITFDMTDISASAIQISLNEKQAEGYEMTAIHGGIIFMRSIPPNPITQRDVIMEILRRKKINEVENGDFDTVGAMQ